MNLTVQACRDKYDCILRSFDTAADMDSDAVCTASDSTMSIVTQWCLLDRVISCVVYCWLTSCTVVLCCILLGVSCCVEVKSEADVNDDSERSTDDRPVPGI